MLARGLRKADISCDRDQLPGARGTRLREVAWIPKPAKRTSKAPSAAAPLQYQSGFGNHFSLGSGARRAAGRPQFAAAAAARPLRRIDLGHLVHHPARREPAHLDLPHPALRGAPALCAHRQRPDPQRAVQRRRCDADAIALEPDPDSENAHRLHRGHGDHGRQRRRRHPGRHVRARLCRQPLDDRPLLLQCRRRNADRAAARPRALRHRARHRRGVARRDRRHSARPALSRRAAGRAVARLYLRELRRGAAAAGARPARLQRSCQCARFSQRPSRLTRTPRRRAP